ncbi:unnamed protein product [Enterobius vermicularis]|uniref:C-type lectin domain-containing protein n=1 Tax=Enterobius vermicularis TaxID=51028 RepID=A0A3P6I212_ENTVE|nr:unnamed protein product [Enterobius vermicularis]
MLPSFSVCSADRCDEGWRYSPHSGKCYKFYPKDSSWALAEFKCFFNGGHHVSLHSVYDNQFARELAKGAKTIWLGNAQFGKSVDYVWTDHSPYNYESWPHGIRPPRISGRQCTKMNIVTGEWFQSCCKVPSPYICQKDARLGSQYDSHHQKLHNIVDNSNVPLS